MPTVHVPPLNLASLSLGSPEVSPPLSDPHRPKSAPRGPAGTNAAPVSLRRLPLTPGTRARGGALVQRLSQAFDPTVRAAGWGQRYNDAGAYAAKFWEAAVLEACRFGRQPGARLVDMLHGLAERRRAIASAAQDSKAHLFGRWRNALASDGLMTPMGGVYAEDRAVRAFLPRFLAGDKQGVGEHVLDDSLGDRPLWTILGKLPDGTTAELTTWDSAADIPRIWHATPAPAVMAHLETLFQAAWSHPSHDVPGLMRQLARLQWWMAHACIFTRGSAGISDMVATCVLWHHGWKRPKPCPATSIDLAALCSPCEAAFVASYASLFEQAPQPFGALTQRDAQDLAARP